MVKYKPYKNIAIVRHSLVEHSNLLALRIVQRYEKLAQWRIMSEIDISKDDTDISFADMVVAIGGDGTILHTARVAAPIGLPVLGVNTGRVGFMSEIEAEEAEENIGWYLSGHGYIEERHMLLVKIEQNGEEMLALNDVTLHRMPSLGVIDIAVYVNGAFIAYYRGDGLLIATATGSTGYALTLGGPVMDPQLSNFLIKPIATHMSQAGGVLLPNNTKIKLIVHCKESFSLSVDGIDEHQLENKSSIIVKEAGLKTRFIRRAEHSSFWENMSRKLGILKVPIGKNTTLEK